MTDHAPSYLAVGLAVATIVACVGIMKARSQQPSSSGPAWLTYRIQFGDESISMEGRKFDTMERCRMQLDRLRGEAARAPSTIGSAQIWECTRVRPIWWPG